MLESRWNQLCENTGLDGRAGWMTIAGAYGEPTRAYHNLNHVGDCLGLLDEYVHLAADPVAVELAIWFHDLVYDPRAVDNEELSAQAAVGFLGAGAFGPVVAELIMATKHAATPETPDARLICDIDLSILGRPSARYAVYAEAIRKEYAWVPRDRYAEARIRVLEGFLARPALFTHLDFQQRFGGQAGANMTWEIRELTAATATTQEPNP